MCALETQLRRLDAKRRASRGRQVDPAAVESAGAASRRVRWPGIRPLAAAAAVMLAWPAVVQHAAAEGSADKATVSSGGPAVAASAPGKDVVLDRPAPDAGTSIGGRLVPTPEPQVSVTMAVGGPHDVAAAAKVGDLALALMRHQSAASGQAQANAVLSPLSVASALGLVHTASAGNTAAELAALMDATTAGDRYFRQLLPRQLAQLDSGASPLSSANRLWVSPALAATMPEAFAALAAQRLRADAAVADFAAAEAARQQVNGWVAQQTQGRIAELLPKGSVRPGTQAIVTNAVHFKAPWAKPFDAARTRELPFTLSDGTVKQVPTMVDERPVAQGLIGGIQVMALPFKGDGFKLLIAMAPAGHTLDAMQSVLSGLDIATWSSGLKPSTCRLQLPRFALQGNTMRLKPALQALGVRTAFGDDADFTPLAGAAGRKLSLSEVFHSANIVIDESGGEASAGTAAVADVKSFRPPAPRCAVDRPFLFSIVHSATQTPVFVGKVADPSAG
ncbi:MAG: serpin family protein [Rhodoferax sp.]|nr:serpin family protein [Rhodoferax sp.]